MEARDELAARGFADPASYRVGRPTYPADAVAHLAEALDLARAGLVVDLGAGTGIFTRQILPLCRRVVAVEPSAGMRQAFAETLTGVEVLEGRDTEIPFADGAVDVVTVAQAFHWFDYERALAEIGRVLSPTGRLGLIWNERDESVDWVHRMSEAMLWTTRQPYRVGMDFSPILRRGPFVDVERRTFTHRQVLDRAGLEARVLSTSYIQTMTDDEQRDILEAVAHVVEPFGDTIEVPYLTTTYVARRAPVS